jgi:hypothetical protein
MDYLLVCGLMNPAAAPVNDEANISPEKIHEIAELLFPVSTQSKLKRVRYRDLIDTSSSFPR